MQALIKVTSNADGNQVVSARDLHIFLEVKTRLDNWMNRMIEYGFMEDVDFQRVYKFGQTVNGKPKNVFEDCILTLDTAKHISMIQRTEKGMQARQYFIECEKKLTQVKDLTTQAKANYDRIIKEKDQQISRLQREVQDRDFIVKYLRESNDRNAEHADKLLNHWEKTQNLYFKESDRLMKAMEEVLELREKVKVLGAAKPAGEPSAAGNTLPELTTQTKINRLVRNYIGEGGFDYKAIYNWIYTEMADRYHIAPLKWKLPKGASIIAEVERRGYIEKMLAVAEYLLLPNQQVA